MRGRPKIKRRDRWSSPPWLDTNGIGTWGKQLRKCIVYNKRASHNMHTFPKWPFIERHTTLVAPMPEDVVHDDMVIFNMVVENVINTWSILVQTSGPWSFPQTCKEGHELGHDKCTCPLLKAIHHSHALQDLCSWSKAISSQCLKPLPSAYDKGKWKVDEM